MRLDLYGNVMIICNSLDKRNIMIAKVLILFDKSSETGCFLQNRPKINEYLVTSVKITITDVMRNIDANIR